MQRYLDSNRALWDQMTPIHVVSEFYGVDRFRAGECTLPAVELEEVGAVRGKSLLHLQCHFGLDSLSWARRGAQVTGVDFSGVAIAQARALADELGLAARFVQSEICALPESLTGSFDLVYTSAGVLCWLPDLNPWAEVIAHFLKPGGRFYLREFHPLAGIFDDRPGTTAPQVFYPYFHRKRPLRFKEDQGTYADPDAEIQTVSYEWPHSLSDTINALLAAGLRLEFLHEFPYTIYRSHPFLEAGRDGLWRYPAAPQSLPLLFSLAAHKPTT